MRCRKWRRWGWTLTTALLLLAQEALDQCRRGEISDLKPVFEKNIKSQEGGRILGRSVHSEAVRDGLATSIDTGIVLVNKTMENGGKLTKPVAELAEKFAKRLPYAGDILEAMAGYAQNKGLGNKVKGEVAENISAAVFGSFQPSCPKKCI
jgi:hypothetical protein